VVSVTPDAPDDELVGALWWNKQGRAPPPLVSVVDRSGDAVWGCEAHAAQPLDASTGPAATRSATGRPLGACCRCGGTTGTRRTGDGRTDLPEDLAVRTPDLLPPADVGHEHAGPHDVLQPRARLLERELDAAQRLARLLPDVVSPDRAAALRCCCRAGDRHPLADTHRPRVADERLPRAPEETDRRLITASSCRVERGAAAAAPQPSGPVPQRDRPAGSDWPGQLNFSPSRWPSSCSPSLVRVTARSPLRRVTQSDCSKDARTLAPSVPPRWWRCSLQSRQNRSNGRRPRRALERGPSTGRAGTSCAPAAHPPPRPPATWCPWWTACTGRPPAAAALATASSPWCCIIRVKPVGASTSGRLAAARGRWSRCALRRRSSAPVGRVPPGRTPPAPGAGPPRRRLSSTRLGEVLRASAPTVPAQRQL